jgi:hypothetical protein
MSGGDVGDECSAPGRAQLGETLVDSFVHAARDVR